VKEGITKRKVFLSFVCCCDSKFSIGENLKDTNQNFFRLNTEDPILNEQLKSFNNTTSKVKKGKIAKNITSYDSLYQACWKAHHEHLITHALSKPEKHPDSLNLVQSKFFFGISVYDL
jgi:hypothetical protein